MTETRFATGTTSLLYDRRRLPSCAMSWSASPSGKSVDLYRDDARQDAPLAIVTGRAIDRRDGPRLREARQEDDASDHRRDEKRAQGSARSGKSAPAGDTPCVRRAALSDVTHPPPPGRAAPMGFAVGVTGAPLRKVTTFPFRSARTPSDESDIWTWREDLVERLADPQVRAEMKGTQRGSSKRTWTSYHRSSSRATSLNSRVVEDQLTARPSKQPFHILLPANHGLA